MPSLIEKKKIHWKNNKLYFYVLLCKTNFHLEVQEFVVYLIWNANND